MIPQVRTRTLRGRIHVDIRPFAASGAFQTTLQYSTDGEPPAAAVNPSMLAAWISEANLPIFLNSVAVTVSEEPTSWLSRLIWGTPYLTTVCLQRGFTPTKM